VTPPGGEIGVTSFPVSKKKSLKARITRKRCAIKQKLTLITNRKSAIAVQNLTFNLTCAATWRRNRLYVTSGFIKKSCITRKWYAIEQKLTLIADRKSAITVQNLSFNLTCDATWRRNRRYVTSGFIKKSLKSRITQKRCAIKQKLTLITNRKSAIAVQNLSFNLTCDATWRINRRYVTSGFIKKSLKSRITRKRYAIEQKLTLIANRKLAIAVQNLSFNLTCDATWRRNRRYVVSGFQKKITKIAYNSETVRDRAKVNINRK
jgi:hypothetical protein